MKISDMEKSLKSFNNDSVNKPLIELVKYDKGEKREEIIDDNIIIFILNGGLKYHFHDYPLAELDKGNILFLPAGYQWSYSIEDNIEILIFRLYNPMKLCEGYFIERLSGLNSEDNNTVITAKLNPLIANQRLWGFLNLLADCIIDGVKGYQYFEIKIRELLIVLRTYYTKQELQAFFSLILSRDISFSEYVRSNYHKYSTVIALAESMYLSHRQFAKRFKDIFHQNPQEWMSRQKALNIHNQIITTKKPIKQIAFESGFGSIAQFTRFCKKELGVTPAVLRLDASKNQ